MNWNNYVKIETFCPKESAKSVRLAIGEAGGGLLGDYQYCAFLSNGRGYFKPMDGSNPTIGNHGEIAEVEETKIEFACEKSKVKTVIKAIKKAHPYEKVWIGITQLLDFDDKN